MDSYLFYKPCKQLFVEIKCEMCLKCVIILGLILSYKFSCHSWNKILWRLSWHENYRPYICGNFMTKFRHILPLLCAKILLLFCQVSLLSYAILLASISILIIPCATNHFVSCFMHLHKLTSFFHYSFISCTLIPILILRM